MSTRTTSRTKARRPVHAPKLPERKATSRAAAGRANAPRADEPQPSLREPAPKTVFVYVNGERRDVPADTLAAALGTNVRHTDVARKPVTATELVTHSMKYLAD